MRKLIFTAVVCSFISISAQASTLAFVCPTPSKIMIRFPQTHDVDYYQYIGDFGYSPQSSKPYNSSSYLGKPFALIGNSDGYKSVVINGAAGTMSCWYKSRKMSTSSGEVINLVSPDNMLGTANSSYTCMLGNKKIDFNHTQVTCTGSNVEDCQVVCNSQAAIPVTKN